MVKSYLGLVKPNVHLQFFLHFYVLVTGENPDKECAREKTEIEKRKRNESCTKRYGIELKIHVELTFYWGFKLFYHLFLPRLWRGRLFFLKNRGERWGILGVVQKRRRSSLMLLEGNTMSNAYSPQIIIKVNSN